MYFQHPLLQNSLYSGISDLNLRKTNFVAEPISKDEMTRISENIRHFQEFTSPSPCFPISMSMIDKSPFKTKKTKPSSRKQISKSYATKNIQTSKLDDTGPFEKIFAPLPNDNQNFPELNIEETKYQEQKTVEEETRLHVDLVISSPQVITLEEQNARKRSEISEENREINATKIDDITNSLMTRLTSFTDKKKKQLLDEEP